MKTVKRLSEVRQEVGPCPCGQTELIVTRTRDAFSKRHLIRLQCPACSRTHAFFSRVLRTWKI